MIQAIPPRLRASAIMLAGGMVIAVVVAAANGWTALLAIGPVVLVIAFG
jgi:1,4-dihydroxy-2-naphthoate octaprenyltransferase